MSFAQSHQQQERGGQGGQNGGDPFSSESFDPIDFINSIFPASASTNASIHEFSANINTNRTNINNNTGGKSTNLTNTNGFALLEQKLRHTSKQMDRDVRKSIRDRSIAGERVANDVALAEKAAEQ